MINSTIKDFVVRRAENRCEYCHLPQVGFDATFNIDHIISSQHRRDDDPTNLALSCPMCNRKKGPNLSGIDPVTNQIVTLFNPRNERWNDHFGWNGALVAGLTPCGRATVAVLDMNDQERVLLRQALIDEGIF